MDKSLRLFNALVSIQSSVKNKAFLTLMLSSGMPKRQILNLTINDFFKASGFRGEEVNGSIGFFYKLEFVDMHNIFKKLVIDTNSFLKPLLWRYESNNKQVITFSSEESYFYIILSLNERINEENISLDSKLVDIPSSTVTGIFNKSERLSDDDSLKVTGNDLLTHFEHACILGIPEDESARKYSFEGKGKYSRDKINYIKLFTKGLDNEDEFYVNAENNIEKLRKCYYTHIMPRVSINNFNSKFESLNHYLLRNQISEEIENLNKTELIKSLFSPTPKEDMTAEESMLYERIKSNLIFDRLAKISQLTSLHEYTENEINIFIESYFTHRLNQNIHSSNPELIQILDLCKEYAYKNAEEGYNITSPEYMPSLLFKVTYIEKVKKQFEDMYIPIIGLNNLVDDIIKKIEPIFYDDSVDGYIMDMDLFKLNLYKYIDENFVDDGNPLYLKQSDIIRVIYQTVNRFMEL